MTIWPPSLWSWLKVWKNSSWSSCGALEELDVVDEEDVDVAVAALEARACALARMASTNSFMNVSVET